MNSLDIAAVNDLVAMERRSIHTTIGLCGEGILWWGNLFEGYIPEECPGRLLDHKSVCVGVMTAPPWLTHRHTVSQTDRHLLTGYTIRSASWSNTNRERDIWMTSFTICMTLYNHLYSPHNMVAQAKNQE